MFLRQIPVLDRDPQTLLVEFTKLDRETQMQLWDFLGLDRDLQSYLRRFSNMIAISEGTNASL